MTEFRLHLTLEKPLLHTSNTANPQTDQSATAASNNLKPSKRFGGKALGWYAFANVGLLLAASLVGCGQRLPYVSGSVTLDGELVRGSDNLQCIVLFFPADGNGAPAFAVVDDSGKYSLDTGSTTGAREGRYEVAITVAEITIDTSGGLPRTRHLAPEKYADPKTSGWTVEVVRGSNEFDFSMQTQSPS